MTGLTPDLSIASHGRRIPTRVGSREAVSSAAAYSQADYFSIFPKTRIESNSGEFDGRHPAPSRRSPSMPESTPARRDLVYQVGTIRSLLTGVYEGDVSFGELAHYGDFGLGTFDAVNGEMIALGGEFHRIDAEGNAHRVTPSTKSPFAVMTHFRALLEDEVHEASHLTALTDRIHTNFESENIIYAVRITGEFAHIDARSEHPQPPGHHPLSETISEVQTQLSYEDVRGTLVGFWFPQHMKAINVPGFHFHFLDQHKKVGGHVFDLRIRHGRVEIMPIFDFGMHLLHTPLFESADLTGDRDLETKRVEQSPA